MKIKEVEQLLSVSRSNIRFYEKQGLLSPERHDNNYRDYSEADIVALKRIIVLRKMGFTVEEIALIQEGKLSIHEAIPTAQIRLEEEIQQLTGALNMLKQLSREQTTLDDKEINRYWDFIHNAEISGEKFMDICKDYLQFELYLFDNMWKNVFFFDFKKLRERHGPLIACIILFILCLWRGLARVVIHHESFWPAFLYPFELMLIGSIIVLPLYILRKKAPKIASFIAIILSILIFLFFGAIALVLIYGIVKSIIT